MMINGIFAQFLIKKMLLMSMIIMFGLEFSRYFL